MSLTLEVDGTRYGDFTEASVELRMDSLCRAFSFSASSEDARPLPFVGGERCKIYVDDELVLTGFVEIVQVKGDSGSHDITVKGRDRTCDLLDSSFASLSDVRAPISLRSLAQRVIAHLGQDLKVVDQANAASFNGAEDLSAAEPGKPCFEFLEAHARKRQVLLASDANGDLLIQRPSGERVDATLVHRADDSNNVLSYDVKYDQTNRFRVYKYPSQKNATAAAKAGTIDLGALTFQGEFVSVTDGAVRRGRQFVVPPETGSSSAESDKRAKWEANVRRARGRVYGCVVDGYRNQAGELWRTNTLVRVDDEFAGIDSVMMINEVTFGLTDGDGSTTTLALVERDAYSIEVTEPKADEKELGLGLSE